MDFIDGWELEKAFEANIKIAISTAEAIDIFAVLAFFNLGQALAAMIFNVATVLEIADVAGPVAEGAEDLGLEGAGMNRFKQRPLFLQNWFFAI